MYVLSKEEGGRHTPFFKGYRPQFYFRTTDVTGTIELPEGVEMVMPGDNIKMVVTLIAPIAMDDGLRFAIREGGRTVGAGVVAKVIAIDTLNTHMKGVASATLYFWGFKWPVRYFAKSLIEVVSVSKPAIFLDRDGVINEDTGYVSKVDDFHFCPGSSMPCSC